MDVLTLFVGSKNFWRLRTNVDFHIVEHLKLQCIEVICFHPVLHLETRLYFPTMSIISSLNQDKLEEILREKREELTRRREMKTAEELLYNDRLMMVDFILSRSLLEVELSNFKLTVKDCIHCEPDPKVIPFEVPERRKLVR